MIVRFGESEHNLTGEIYDGLCIRQEFIAKTPHLLSVNVYFATYQRQNHGTIVVDVRDYQHRVVAEGKVDASRLEDNSFREFGLGAKMIPGRKYELRIWTSHCRAGQSVTSCYGRVNEGGALFIGARLIRDSELYCEFNYEGDLEDYAGTTLDPDSLELAEGPPIPEDTIPGLVSIVIPHYNCLELLPMCLASLAAQTYSCMEVFVIDDGSEGSAGAADIVGTFRSVLPALTFIQHDKNYGAPKARNTGADQARGEYLFFCDSDVMLYADTIETLVRCLLNVPGADFSYGGFIWGNQRVVPVPFDESLLRKGNFVSTNSMLRRSKFPGWDEELKRHQDWDLFLTMVDNGSIGVCSNTYLFETPIREGSISTDSNMDMMQSKHIVNLKHKLANK